MNAVAGTRVRVRHAHIHICGMCAKGGRFVLTLMLEIAIRTGQRLLDKSSNYYFPATILQPTWRLFEYGHMDMRAPPPARARAARARAYICTGDFCAGADVGNE